MANEQTGSDENAELAGPSPALGKPAPAPTPSPTPAPTASLQTSDPRDTNAEYRRKFDEAAIEFGSDAYVFKRIEMLRRQNVPAVLFLGVRTSGKTWLMQRMKHRLRAKYDCRPPLAIARERVMSSSDVQTHDAEDVQKELALLPPRERAARLERTAANATDRTGAIIFHSFIHRTGSFALIDVPGERIEQIGDDNFSANRDLLAALDYASAIIVAMPSEVVLLGTELCRLPHPPEGDEALARLQEDVDLLEAFTDGIGTIASVRSFIQHAQIPLRWQAPGDPPDRFEREVTKDAVEEHRYQGETCDPIGGPDGRSCPAFFALTKADRFFATLGTLPDAANDSAKLAESYEAANQALQTSAEVALLRQCYGESPINPANRPLDNDLFSRIMRSLFGTGAPTVEISNPPELVRTFNPTLFNRLTDYMPMSRLDLVAAFYGNTKNVLARGDFDQTGFVGVDELIAWLGQVRQGGINDWHVWARTVFRRLYGSSEDLGGPLGPPGRFAFRKRLKWVPLPVLKLLFRKEWHPVQWAPLGLSILAAAGMSLATFDWREDTQTFDNARRYEAFEKAIDAASRGVRDTAFASAPEAIRAIKPLLPMPASLTREGVEDWNPVEELGGWTTRGNRVAVRPSFSPRPDDSGLPAIQYETVGRGDQRTEVPRNNDHNRFLETRADQRSWMDTYVCPAGQARDNLAAWGKYRDILRKAIINGYGQCGALVKLKARSPVLDMLGLPGMIVLLGGWLVVVGGFVYAYWLRRTRAAYGWLYHSSAATSRRAETQGGNGEAG